MRPLDMRSFAQPAERAFHRFIDASERYGDLAQADNLWWVYDFSSGAYSITQNKTPPTSYVKTIAPFAAREVDPDALAATAVR